jgi:hypothetical protein
LTILFQRTGERRLFTLALLTRSPLFPALLSRLPNILVSPLVLSFFRQFPFPNTYPTHFHGRKIALLITNNVVLAMQTQDATGSYSTWETFHLARLAIIEAFKGGAQIEITG